MQAIVARQVLSPALLPGATGRADTSALARAAAVARLTSLLDDAALAPGAPRTEAGEALVLVVAPARRSSTAVDARPDLGALGLQPPSLQARAGGGPGTRASTGASGSPTLDVTATVAVTLLRLAGWDGLVETVEIAGHAGDGEDHVLDAVVSSALTGPRLVLLALGSDEAELPAGARPALAAAHVRVRALADRLDAARVTSDAAPVT